MVASHRSSSSTSLSKRRKGNAHMPDYRVQIDTIWSTTEDVEPDELHDYITELLEDVDLEFEYRSIITPDGEFQTREKNVDVGVNCDTITLVTVTRLED